VKELLLFQFLVMDCVFYVCLLRFKLPSSDFSQCTVWEGLVTFSYQIGLVIVILAGVMTENRKFRVSVNPGWV